MICSMTWWRRRSLHAVVVVVACAVVLVAERAAARGGQGEHIVTGNVRIDLFGLRTLDAGPILQQDQAPLALPSHKSPWLAAGMAAVVPGTGQLYTGSYWEAALFFAADAVAWVLAYKYDAKGDRQTDLFQDFANANWSVVKYAEFTAANLVPAGKKYDWRKAGTEGMDPFDRPWTQVNWDVINQMERDIGGYYSHTLPPYNEQQYYELIGKYPQFNQGWRDADPSIGSDYETIKAHLTPMFLWYADQRGLANDYYTSATKWVTIALINHLLSAADAAWSSIRYNNAQASAGVRLVPAGDGYAWMGVVQVRIKI
jgi:hypothetical protein